MKCKSCDDTGLVRQGVCIKVCERCESFERVTEDAIVDAQVELGDSSTVRLLRAENDTAARRVRELEGIIETGTAENKRQHDELAELRSRLAAMTTELAALKASTAETARTETDAVAAKKAK